MAAAAGVSHQTVSNALNAPEKLRPETLQRVLATIRELGYQPNRAAQSLRRKESKLIGLRLYPVEENRVASLFDRFLHALAHHFHASGHYVLPFTPPHPEDELSGFKELLRGAVVDAFVITNTHRRDGRLSWLAERGVPFVAFGRPWDEGSQHLWVDIDGAAGTGLAVDHLVTRGHQRIGFISWAENSDLGNNRLSGWAAACRRHSLSCSGLAVYCEDQIDEGARGAAYLLDLPEPPTALVCASDTLALGALATLHNRGLRPGTDVAVTGFDDSVTAGVIPGGLTSLRQPLEDAAEAIVKSMNIALLGGHVQNVGELLYPSLIIRGSS